MTKEAIEEYGRSILARQQKSKMTTEDIAAAKAVKEILGIYDPTNKGEGAKSSEGEQKAVGGNKDEGAKKESGSAEAPAAPATETPPPELDPNAVKDPNAGLS